MTPTSAPPYSSAFISTAAYSRRAPSIFRSSSFGFLPSTATAHFEIVRSTHWNTRTLFGRGSCCQPCGSGSSSCGQIALQQFGVAGGVADQRLHVPALGERLHSHHSDHAALFAAMDLNTS